MASRSEDLKAALTLPGVQPSSKSVGGTAKQWIHALLYQAYTMYLFTASDFKTTIIPSVTFALATGVGAKGYDGGSLAWRLPMAFFYAWFNTLAFTINNQRHPSAVGEDRVNKPWRPIPAGRLSRTTADPLGLASYPLTMIVSKCVTGGVTYCMILAGLGLLYNDLAGSSRHWLVRNVLNGLGLVTFYAGTYVVLTDASLPSDLLLWLGIIFLIISSTIHGPDVFDQEGDRAQHRGTIPLIYGDVVARVSLIVMTLFWSVVAPWWWQTRVGGVVLGSLGLLISWRWWTRRSVVADRMTFTLYTVWTGLVYGLPLVWVL